MASLVMVACHKETYDESLQRSISEESHKFCPKKIDRCTTLDSMTYSIRRREVVYWYTFRGELDNDSVLIPKVVEEYREGLLSTLRQSIHLKRQKEHGVSFVHRHMSGKSGRKLLEIRFTKRDYR